MPFVRALPASHFTPSASTPAARTDTSAPKTSDASPFALLVDAAASSPARGADKKTTDSKSGAHTDSGAGDKTEAGHAAAPQTTGRFNAQPQGSTDGDSRTAANSGKDTQPSERDAESASDLLQAAADALPDMAQPPAPPAGPLAQAANDDDKPADDTVANQDAAQLLAQTIASSANPGAPQTKPAKSEKPSKTDIAAPDAAPDDAAPGADASADQQPVAVAAAILPPPPVPLPALPAQAQPPAAAPAIPPAAQLDLPTRAQIDAANNAQAGAGNGPVVPSLPQPDGAIPAQQAAQNGDQADGPNGSQPQQGAGPSTAQPNDRTADRMPPAVAAALAAATPPSAAPPVAPQPSPVTSKIAADKTAPTAANNQIPPDAPRPAASQPAAPQDAPQPGAAKTAAPEPDAKTASIKPAKSYGEIETDQDSTIAKSAESAPVAPNAVRQAETPAAPAAASEPAIKTSDTAVTPATGLGAAPQASGSSVVHHIQVSAQPREAVPNMPALAVEIAAKSQSGAKQFDIRLDPPELGRVEVRLSIDATGKASAHLSADQPQTLTLLQKDAHVLTRALRDAGLDVSQDGLNFSLRQQQDNGAGAQSNQSGNRFGRGFALTATTSLEASAISAAYSGGADGHLDIRV